MAAAPATAGVSTTSLTPTTTTNLNPEEASLKATNTSKLGTLKAKQSENTAPGSAQRLPSTQKAWTGPSLAQRTLTQQQNGATAQLQSVVTGGGPALLREGLKVKITLDTGAEFEGVYLSGSDSTYTLKMVEQKKLPGSQEMPNGNSRTNRERGNMTFQKKDVADIHVTGTALPSRDVRTHNGNSTGFRTDTAISGNKFQTERTLKRWVPDESIETDKALESGRNASGGASWDQFAVNERLFGLSTDYDETIYTTAIDKSHPDYKKRYAEADRLAREIEHSGTDNRHVAEERVTDNLTVDESGLDEEDKYSGVQRSFASLTSSGRPDKYTPPARRAPAGQATVSGAPVDPAIISSQLARPDKIIAETNKSSQPAKVPSSEVSTPQTTAESSFAATPEPKVTPANTSSTSVSRNASPQTRAAGAPNATATVERDVVSAFKGFAAQQRSQADKLRSNKAKADKEVKLHELKKFAATFKLDTPLPSDLVAIIAKDPAKQREIQETARRNAEEETARKLAEQTKAKSAKGPSETPSPGTTASEAKPAPRPTATTQGAVSTTSVPTRQAQGRTGAFPPQAPYSSQSFRNDRSGRSQPNSAQGVPAVPLSTRLRSIEQSKNGQLPTSPEVRQPPTGPANGVDPAFSRRSSGAISALSGKLNPNSNEFRPSPFAASFNPNGTPATTPGSRSNSVATTAHAIPSPSGSLLRRKPGQAKTSEKPKLDIMECVAKLKPEVKTSKAWIDNGNFKPSFDYPATWRVPLDDEPAGSTMNLTFSKILETHMFSHLTMSPPQPSHVNPQVAHQHQLPFHLQQGAHNMSQRQSPRQPALHMQNNQHNHGMNGPFNGSDDHRMMPSHSAQSYASPRLQQVNMAYPSPMGQPAQLAYNPAGMQYPMGPGGPPMSQFRSYSGGNQFVPQQATHMGGPVMIQGPGGNAFIPGPGGMMSPAPPMVYPVGQPHFVPQGNPPPMPGANGYPSPGRGGAPMMMNQGSQQGQPVYGMSPGMQYGQPIYAQQQPGQMPNMRGYPPQGQQQFGTSPQMHQYNQSHRGVSSGNYNKNFQQHHNNHAPAHQNQPPTGPQSLSPAGAEEAK